jgi:hypothetical protein
MIRPISPPCLFKRQVEAMPGVAEGLHNMLQKAKQAQQQRQADAVDAIKKALS